tara:strand:- start:55 stop:879 length:825 start_codon:yes stop_codon:yes gene_type:complete
LGNTFERRNNFLSQWRSIDVNDGGWTLYDPNSTIVSATTTTDGIRLVTDKDTTGSSNRMSTSQQGAGRYWQKLVGPDGDPLTFADFFSIEVLIKCHQIHANHDDSTSFPAGDRSGVTVGFSGPGVTDSTSFNFVNITLYVKGTGANPKMQAQGGGKDGMISGEDTHCRGVYCLMCPAIDDDDAGDDNPSIRDIAYQLLDSNNDATHDSNALKRAGVNNLEFTKTDEVYLFFSNNWGTDVSNIADADGTWKVWYRVNVARDGLNPTYVPGGGLSG